MYGRRYRRGWAVATLLLAACATAPARSEEPGPRTVVEVDNDLVPRRAITIRILADGHPGERLGEVRPGGRQRFDVARLGTGRSYRLLAVGPDDFTATSQRFTLLPGSVVRWSLQANTLVLDGS